MAFVLQPWQLLLAILAAWFNRQQQAVIDFQRTEIQILRELLGKKRILLNDDQRRRLAVKGKTLGRKMLEEIGTIVTPDTILRWHRQLVAEKWTFTERRSKAGRPPTPPEIVDLVLRFARENPTWGYDRIQAALANLGHNITDATVGNILRAHGIEPVPDRKRQTTWKTFLKAHWDVLASVDFTTIEVWTCRGLVTYYLLFVMDVATRRVHFAGCTPHPGVPYFALVALRAGYHRTAIRAADVYYTGNLGKHATRRYPAPRARMTNRTPLPRAPSFGKIAIFAEASWARSDGFAAATRNGTPSANGSSRRPGDT